MKQIKAISTGAADTFNAVLEREMKEGWTPILDSYNASHGGGSRIFSILMEKEVDCSNIEKPAILGRIRSYFELGGLFNPELMDPGKVRQLLVDCGEYITNH
jgi:hypothetical protein